MCFIDDPSIHPFHGHVLRYFCFSFLLLFYTLVLGVISLEICDWILLFGVRLGYVLSWLSQVSFETVETVL